MNKNTCAVIPPMGWNSYDYYDTTVNENQVKANADYMSKHLKDSGWEYIIVDIEWYAYNAGSMRDKYQYIPFEKVAMDEYSRLQPCEQRFPSAAGGQGFKPLSDYVHSKGLKFGIHIMRGIPREAAHNHMPIEGTNCTANEIADPSSICNWNPDMYGLNVNAEGAQEYYDSIFRLYAAWGVDFVKCDDICRHDMQSCEKEIEMLNKAIENSGREMVLSLSPGPALINKAWHYEKYANMWRITDDFWDSWPLLLNMFDRCEIWQKHVSQGCYPDCDMLPLGYLGYGFGEERYTNFTKNEQITMMTLWCMFRSPLMLGSELTKLDDWTLELITNKEVLGLLKHSKNARQIMRNDKQAVWLSEDSVSDDHYLAVFNFTEDNMIINVTLEDLELDLDNVKGQDLWSGETVSSIDKALSADTGVHGARLFRLYRA